MEKEKTTKEKLEEANNLKLLFCNGDCGKCRLQFLKQQAKELLEVKIIGYGRWDQEENNQANKILKEITNHE